VAAGSSQKAARAVSTSGIVPDSAAIVGSLIMMF
jgi:hypothetical protein